MSRTDEEYLGSYGSTRREVSRGVVTFTDTVEMGPLSSDGNMGAAHAADVIVVEDNDNDARMTVMALKKIQPSLTVQVIVDGALAVEALTGPRALRPRLVFLDLKLPKIGGLEVLRAIKADPTSSGLTVMVLTSSDEPKDVARAHELRCDRYLCKPIDMHEYLQVVREAATPFLMSAVCHAGC